MNDTTQKPRGLVRAYRYHSLLPIEAQNRLIEAVGLREAETAVQRDLRERLTELRANIRSFSELGLDPSTVLLSDASVRVGVSSPKAKYSDQDLIHCFDLRLAGLSLREISQKMDIPIRTLRDIFSGKRRAVIPTKFK